MIADGNERIALGLREDPQRAGQVARDLIEACPAGGARQDANHDGIQGLGNFSLRRRGQFRGVDEKGFAVAVSHRAGDAVRPRILHRLPENLEHPEFARLQLRQRRDQADERIKLAGRQRQQEFLGQPKFHGKCVVADTVRPRRFQRALPFGKLHVREMCRQLFPHQ